MTAALRQPNWPLELVQIPIAELCLCPACYWIATEQSELCLRCTLDGCDHQENRHG
jgi:hypothetical protein